MIIFIIVCAIIVYVVYQIYSEGEKQEKIDANKKQVADYERKMELECKELRQKFYNSSATREIADYILVGKSESPFKVKIDLEGITAFFQMIVLLIIAIAHTVCHLYVVLSALTLHGTKSMMRCYPCTSILKRSLVTH